MKVCIFLALLALSMAGIPRPEEARDAPEPEVAVVDVGDLDPEDNLDEDQFEEEFGLEKVTDPVEKAKRNAALKEAEDEVKKENKKFLNGEADWFEDINEFSDLPEAEVKKENKKFLDGEADWFE